MYNFLLFSDVLYGRTFTIPMFWHKFLQLFRKFRDRMLEKAKIQPGVSNFSSSSSLTPPSPPWNFISVPARGIVGASFIALYTPRYYFHRFTDFYIFELMNIKACGFNLFPRPPNGNYFSCSGGGGKKKRKKNILSSSRAIKTFFFFYETISKSEFSANLGIYRYRLGLTVPRLETVILFHEWKYISLYIGEYRAHI